MRFWMVYLFVRDNGKRKRSLKSPSFLKEIDLGFACPYNEETVDGFSLLQRELAMTEKLVKQTLSKQPAK